MITYKYLNVLPDRDTLNLNKMLYNTIKLKTEI